ncbi:MAG TPA: hypothetical protein VK563_15750 [Puia sp.]|nr:hypothetical protein [Puia sp.]
MEQLNQLTLFQKSLLTGVFVGFSSTVICLVFNVIYRNSTGFTPSAMINVSSLIFSINILFTIIGLLYYVFIKAFRKGSIIFIVVFALFTIFLLWKAEAVRRSDDYTVTLQFRGLLVGIILIAGIGASFFVPFLCHNKSFERHVL